ncbi:MAG: lipocalin family protein [Lysobacterales bacterium]
MNSARMISIRWLALLLLLSLILGCAASPTRHTEARAALSPIAREHMLGNWYILANVPYFAERGKVAARVEYVQRSDGRLDDLYYFRRTMDSPEERWEGVAWAVDESGARMKARFIWPFATEFWIIALQQDRQIALIATPDAKLAWVYARTPTIDEASYQAALARLREFGVDTETLVRIPQPAS